MPEARSLAVAPHKYQSLRMSMAEEVGKIERGGGRGPVAPPVFKTGLAGIAFAGGFDSLPPPP